MISAEQNPEQRRSVEQQAAAARARALAAEVHPVVDGHGTAGVPGLPPGLRPDGGQRRSVGLGALRVREAAGVSLGHLPRRPVHDRRIGFGDFFGQPVWQEVPGEFRNQLRRLIVTQGDTEPASVEQQRWLGQRCPSLYDLRNLFQVNVEEGRHLWAMVYLLHSYFGRDGRDEAEELLARQSGNRDKPRILDAFNEPIENWLDFFMFTMFTDRDGKSQLLSLSESSLDPLSRTTRFMLTEEAHHMFVGETGIARIIERTCQLMKQAGFSGRRPEARRHRSPDAAEVHQPVVQPEPRSARQRDLDQRGVVLRQRSQGTRPGREVGRPSRHRDVLRARRPRRRHDSSAKRSRCGRR